MTGPDYSPPGDRNLRKRAKQRLVIENEAATAAWLRAEVGNPHSPLAGIFLHGGRLVYTPRVGEAGYVPPKNELDDDGEAQIHALSHKELAARMDVLYTVMRKNGRTLRPALFPDRVAERMTLSTDTAPNVRRLLKITHTPLLRPDGSILDVPGYDTSTRILYLPTYTRFPPIPAAPSSARLKHARLVIEMLISGFPFVSPSDRANYLGALCTPMLRALIPGPYLMTCINAPQLGSGKTYLAGILRDVHGGVFRSEFPRSEEEVRKSVTSILANTTGAVVVWDNVRGVLRSGSLEGLLSAPIWHDRLLGGNQHPLLPNDRLWVATGNGLSYGGDLYRRLNLVTIDANMDAPWTRTDFKIKLPQWARDHRGLIVSCLLTLISGWIREGRPVPAATRTDYEDYVRGVSGLLTFAGFDGTFADPATHTEPIGADDAELAVLLHALRRRFGVETFGVADIVESLEAGQFLDASCLPLELAERWDKRHGGQTSSFGKALGVWLSRLDGRYADALKIVKRGKDRNKVSRFAIVGRETVTVQQPVAEPTPETVPPAPDYSEAWQTEDDDSEDVIAGLEFSPAPVPICTLHERHPDLVRIKRCRVVGCPGE